MVSLRCRRERKGDTRMEEVKMVEFRGFLGDLVLRTEREQREGLSEGGGVLQVMRLARELGTFFWAFFSSFFFPFLLAKQ